MVGYAARKAAQRQRLHCLLACRPGREIDALHRSVIRQGTGAGASRCSFSTATVTAWILLIHRSLTAADGTQLGWMSSVLDIPTNASAPAARRTAAGKARGLGPPRGRGRVASTLAHELNQPWARWPASPTGWSTACAPAPSASTRWSPWCSMASWPSAGGVIQRVNAFARKRELLHAGQPLGLVRRVTPACRKPTPLP